MLLAIDAGNSNIKLALFAGAELVASGRVPTGAGGDGGDCAAEMRKLAGDRSPEAVVIASVVPALNPLLTRLSEDSFHVTPIFVDHTTPAGLKIVYDSPADLGADRIVDAVAAVAGYGAPCIVVDFGTATTFNAIKGDGSFIGGAISPGLATCSEALFARTAKLPRVTVERPASVIGSSTVMALKSGLYYGYAGLVDGILERMIAELDSQPRVVATGGQAHSIAPASRYIEELRDNLTLEGLRIVYERIKS